MNNSRAEMVWSPDRALQLIHERLLFALTLSDKSQTLQKVFKLLITLLVAAALNLGSAIAIQVCGEIYFV